MEKIWFVHLKDRHQGPFSDSDIKQLLKNGELNQHSLIWREGLVHWITLKDSPLSTIGIKTEHLKSNVNHNKKKSVHLFPHKKVKKIDHLIIGTKKRFEESPTDYISTSEAYKDEFFSTQDVELVMKDLEALDGNIQAPDLLPQIETSSVEVSEIDELPPAIPMDALSNVTSNYNKSKLKNFFSIILIFSFIIFAWYYIKATALIPRLDDIAPDQQEKLTKVWQASFTGVPIAEVFFTKNMGKAWFVSNWDEKANLQISLKSIANRVLSTSPIEASGEASLNSKIAEFDNFHFLKGSKLYPGEYAVTVKVLSANNNSYLNQNKGIILNTNLIIKSTSSFAFNQQLKKFNTEVSEDKLKYVADLEEKNSTVIKLSQQIETLMTKHLNQIKKGSEFHLFGQDYQAKIGQLLTQIIVDNEVIYSRINQRYPDLAQEYTGLIKSGKGIAQWIVDTIAFVESKKKIDLIQREHLKDKYKTELRELRESFLLASYRFKDKKKELEKIIVN